jgi:inner membrane protein
VDTLTHALSGALLGRASARSASPDAPRTWERVTVCTLAATFPDSDIVFSWISPLTYLYNHRGITHSIPLLPLWALLLAFVFALILQRDFRKWRLFAGTAALGIGVHIVCDLITSFGTIIFAPLSDARHAWATTFVIDLWFSGIVLAGLIAAAIWRRTRVPAIVAAGLPSIRCSPASSGAIRRNAPGSRTCASTPRGAAACRSATRCAARQAGRGRFTNLRTTPGAC